MNVQLTLLRFCWIVTLVTISCSQTVYGFQNPAVVTVPPNLGKYQVNGPMESIRLISGTTQQLRFDYNIADLFVETQEVVSATPISANEILITGNKPGFSTITFRDQDRNLQTIRINVTVDVRKLEEAYEIHFPNSKIRVAALNESVILSGYVARADQVSNVVAVAKDYFPRNVINELQVNGAQNIAVKVKVYEVSRTKLRQLGVDWSYFGDNVNVVSSISGLIQSISDAVTTTGESTFRAGIVSDTDRFNVFIQALEKHNVAKLLDEPTLVAQNGRPAEFLSGGEIPFEVSAGLGSTTIEFRSFGTKLDLVPIIVGPGQLSLEVRAEVSDVAKDLSGGTDVPGFRVRRVNTSVRMKAGHTLALAGDYRVEEQAEKQGVPWIMDNPFLGPMFRRVEEEANETELVFLLTPRFIGEVEPQQLPRYGVGQLTESPADHELYIDGYMEVPRCNDDCPIEDRFDSPNFRPTPNLLPPSRIPQEIPIEQAVPLQPAAGSPITRSFSTPLPSSKPQSAMEYLKSKFSRKPNDLAKKTKTSVTWRTGGTPR